MTTVNKINILILGPQWRAFKLHEYLASSPPNRTYSLEKKLYVCARLGSELDPDPDRIEKSNQDPE